MLGRVWEKKLHRKEQTLPETLFKTYSYILLYLSFFLSFFFNFLLYFSVGFQNFLKIYYKHFNTSIKKKNSKYNMALSSLFSLQTNSDSNSKTSVIYKTCPYLSTFPSRDKKGKKKILCS